MDIAKFDTVRASNAGIDVKLLNPRTNEPLGITIHVLGRDSEKYKKTLHEQNRKRAQRTKGMRNVIITSEEIEGDALSLLAACTTGWEGLQENGKDLVFSTEEARRVYTEYPWIKEQVDAEVHDRANFTPS